MININCAHASFIHKMEGLRTKLKINQIMLNKLPPTDNSRASVALAEQKVKTNNFFY